MSLQCANCQSLFFKTLETRVLPETAELLYKKRCKRCKYKFLLKQAQPTGGLHPVSRDEWLLALKITLRGSKMVDRARIFVSEYTRRVSHAPEEQLPYLRKIEHAEGVRR